MLIFPEVQRRPFLLALSKALQAARDQDASTVLLLVDVTNLGRINALHGAQVGDVALAMACERLQAASTEEDSVYRISSHHFAFMLPEPDSPALIVLAVNRLRTALMEPMEAGGARFTLEIAIGVTTSHDGTTDPYLMLSRAEGALRNAPQGMTHDFLEEDRDIIDRVQGRLRLEEEFVDALNANAFELAYQPKVNLRTGVVSHCEALLRWPRSGGGHLSPAVAVELAESLNLGYALSKWILSEAARQARRWQDRFSMVIAVNVEATLIDNPDLLNLVSDTLAIWGTDRQLINLEVTESAVVNDEESGFGNLRRLMEMGVGIAIDDFGTGYSSLSYFKHVPAQELKIDQSFVRTLTTDAQNRDLVDIIVKIAHLFDMQVVGEGVETREGLDALIASGSDYAQGYYFSQPLPPAEFEAWLADWPGLTWDPCPAAAP